MQQSLIKLLDDLLTNRFVTSQEEINLAPSSIWKIVFKTNSVAGAGPSISWKAGNWESDVHFSGSTFSMATKKFCVDKRYDELATNQQYVFV